MSIKKTIIKNLLSLIFALLMAYFIDNTFSKYYYIISFLFYLVNIQTITIYNLIVDIRKLERDIIQIRENILKAYENIKNIDREGYFEANDMVGYSFKMIRDTIENLFKSINFEQ